MAANKKYTSDYNAEGQAVGYARPIARTYGGPLDKTGFYRTLQEAQTYAASADAYVGQIVNVIEDNNVTQYVIKNTTGELKVLGGTIEFQGEVFNAPGVVTTNTDGSKIVELNLNGSDPESPANLRMDGTDLRLSDDISVGTVHATYEVDTTQVFARQDVLTPRLKLGDSPKASIYFEDSLNAIVFEFNGD